MAVTPYDPVGALGGTFAPAYIHGDPQSEAAVAAWTAAHSQATNDVINASRNPQAQVDQNALAAAAQGLPYDINARRDAIAAQVVSNAAPASTGYTPKYLPNGTLDPNDPGNIAQYYRLMGGGGAAAAPAASAPVASIGAPAAQQQAPGAIYMPQDYYGGG